MPTEIAAMIFAFSTVTVIGILLVSIPITRRLGRVLEEWVQLRREGAPERGAVDDLVGEVRSLSRHVEALDDRMQILSERQEFTESLVESRSSGTKSLPPTN
jgi:hypothetical protein